VTTVEEPVTNICVLDPLFEDPTFAVPTSISHIAQNAGLICLYSQTTSRALQSVSKARKGIMGDNPQPIMENGYES
jgi:hypothetical protein